MHKESQQLWVDSKLILRDMRGDLYKLRHGRSLSQWIFFNIIIIIVINNYRNEYRCYVICLIFSIGVVLLFGIA